MLRVSRPMRSVDLLGIGGGLQGPCVVIGKYLSQISQYAVESHGTPVGESTKTHPGTGRSTRYYLEGRSEVTMKVQVLQEKAPNGGQGAPRP